MKYKTFILKILENGYNILCYIMRNNNSLCYIYLITKVSSKNDYFLDLKIMISIFNYKIIINHNLLITIFNKIK